MEAAGAEIYRDAKQTERLLHDQELGVLGDPTASAVILGLLQSVGRVSGRDFFPPRIGQAAGSSGETGLRPTPETAICCDS